MKSILKLSVALASVGLSMHVYAHHSTAMYDYSKTETLVGTVRTFQWGNPHTYIQLLVKDANGQNKEWSIEGGTPASMSSMGWTKQSLKPGDKVTIAVAPFRDGGPGGTVKSVTLPDGKVLTGMAAALSGSSKAGPPGGALPSLERATPK